MRRRRVEEERRGPRLPSDAQGRWRIRIAAFGTIIAGKRSSAAPANPQPGRAAWQPENSGCPLACWNGARCGPSRLWKAEGSCRHLHHSRRHTLVLVVHPSRQDRLGLRVVAEEQAEDERQAEGVRGAIDVVQPRAATSSSSSGSTVRHRCCRRCAHAAIHGSHGIGALACTAPSRRPVKRVPVVGGVSRQNDGGKMAYSR